MTVLEDLEEVNRQVIRDVTELTSMKEYWRCRVEIGSSIKMIGRHSTADLWVLLNNADVRSPLRKEWARLELAYRGEINDTFMMLKASARRGLHPSVLTVREDNDGQGTD